MCLFLMAFKETAKDAHGQSDLCTFIAVIKQKMKLISGDSGYFFSRRALSGRACADFSIITVSIVLFFPPTVNRA